MGKDLKSIVNQNVINHVETKPKRCKGLNVLTSYRLNVFKHKPAFTLAEVRRSGSADSTCINPELQCKGMGNRTEGIHQPP